MQNKLSVSTGMWKIIAVVAAILLLAGVAFSVLTDQDILFKPEEFTIDSKVGTYVHYAVDKVDEVFSTDIYGTLGTETLGYAMMTDGDEMLVLANDYADFQSTESAIGKFVPLMDYTKNPTGEKPADIAIRGAVEEMPEDTYTDLANFYAGFKLPKLVLSATTERDPAKKRVLDMSMTSRAEKYYRLSVMRLGDQFYAENGNVSYLVYDTHNVAYAITMPEAEFDTVFAAMKGYTGAEGEAEPEIIDLYGTTQKVEGDLRLALISKTTGFDELPTTAVNTTYTPYSTLVVLGYVFAVLMLALIFFCCYNIFPGLRKKTIKFIGTDEFSAIVPLVLLLVVVWALNQKFLSWDNIRSVLNLVPFIGICCLGNALVIMTGSSDISVGKTSGLACMVFGWMIKTIGAPSWAAIIGGIAIGALIGVINSWFIFDLNLPSFIVTLGMSYIIGSCRYFLSGGYPYTNLGDDLFKFGHDTWNGMYYPFFIAIVLYIVVAIMLAKTTFGRKIKAVGDNSEVAALSGINVVGIKKFAYIACGAIVAVSGILQAIRLDYANPATGTGWEFKCMAACAIGGVSLSGGKGSGLCIAIGMLTMMFLDNAIVMLGIPTQLQETAVGVFLMVAASLDMIKSRQKIRADAEEDEPAEEQAEEAVVA